MNKSWRGRKILYISILTIFIGLFTEAAAYLGLKIVADDASSLDALQQKRAKLIQDYYPRAPAPKAGNSSKSQPRKKGRRHEVIHPYIGYVTNFNDPDCPDYGFCNKYMKHHPTGPLTKKTDDNYIVAIMGGSFAYGVAISSTEHYLSERLKTIPALKDKKIIVHTLSMGGFKQPQQLMAVNYFLALGAHFDLVMNIDGFNEIALPAVDNLPKGSNPYFPRMWATRVKGGARDTTLLTMVGTTEYYKKRRARWAKKASKSPWRSSAIANLIWKLNDNRYKKRVSNSKLAFQSYRVIANKTTQYVGRGPEYEFVSKDAFYQDMANHWTQSSLQMHHLLDGLGIKYFHFLQPNQYVAESKPMSEKEKKIALMEAHPYRRDALNGYPYLIAAGKHLKAKGAPYTDLTMMFVNNKDILYRDACCHLNQQGYDLVIDEMVKTIAPSF